MSHIFYKYQGTGNDFIIVDDRQNEFPRENTSFIQQLCTRRFGIGADGLMLLGNKTGYDFEMVYYNSDGKRSSMCGNGARCLAHFAQFKGAAAGKMRFLAPDGEHAAEVHDGEIHLSMNDVREIEQRGNDFVLDTGSPHYIRFAGGELTDELLMNVTNEIRYGAEFLQDGINVNIVAERENHVEMRTFERGVEDETFSCGTGVTAAAIAAALKQKKTGFVQMAVKTRGGNLRVDFNFDGRAATNILLCGLAVQVFKGELPHA